MEENLTSERSIQTSDTKSAESSQPWVKTYSGGKPNYTEPTIDGWPLYSGLPPPKKEWVGLTNEEISQIYTCAMSDMDFIFDTQAKLKEKNT
jgi:hypothetical protein